MPWAQGEMAPAPVEGTAPSVPRTDTSGLGCPILQIMHLSLRGKRTSCRVSGRIQTVFGSRPWSKCSATAADAELAPENVLAQKRPSSFEHSLHCSTLSHNTYMKMCSTAGASAGRDSGTQSAGMEERDCLRVKCLGARRPQVLPTEKSGARDVPQVILSREADLPPGVLNFTWRRRV
jgi:hypothetical protein